MLAVQLSETRRALLSVLSSSINRKRETTAPPGLPARLARSLPLAIYVYGTLNTIKSYLKLCNSKL